MALKSTIISALAQLTGMKNAPVSCANQLIINYLSATNFFRTDPVFKLMYRKQQTPPFRLAGPRTGKRAGVSQFRVLRVAGQTLNRRRSAKIIQTATLYALGPRFPSQFSQKTRTCDATHPDLRRNAPGPATPCTPPRPLTVPGMALRHDERY